MSDIAELSRRIAEEALRAALAALAGRERSDSAQAVGEAPLDRGSRIAVQG
jgi:hypothetical protein